MNVVEVKLEIEIEAPPADVWRALVDDISGWMHRDFYVGQSPRGFVIEPRPGGHMIEDWGDDGGLVWATVTGVERERWLMLSGELTAAFGGPARTIMEFRLEPTEAGTLVRLEDTVYGQVSEETAASLDTGWRLILGECLKRYVETGERPELPATLPG